MNYTIILASGTGSRCNLNIPKQFVNINGKTVLEYTIEAFNKNELTDRIILITSKDYLEFCKNLKYEKIFIVAEGGKRRQDSSRIGVNLIKEDDAKVLIHDGARPCIKNELINNCYVALDKYNAINTGVETTDTIMEVDENKIIKKIPKRKNLLRCQTPQGFISGLIKKAHKIALEKNLDVTDDAGLIVNLGLDDVFVVDGDIENIKITYKDDIEKAKELLRWFLFL